jgi:hypothetical protein
MKITPQQADILREHGFKWYKGQCTDSVSPDCIGQVIPFMDGFAVIYNNKATALAISIATVSKIEWPYDPAKTWIYVHWDDIMDFSLDEMPEVLKVLRDFKMATEAR